MQMILKVENIDNLDKYMNLDNSGAFALLFGIDNFSIYNGTVSLDKLKNIREKCKNTKIYVALDKNIFNHELELLKDTLKYLDNLSLSGILFYDLAVLNICLEENIKTPLIWNQNFLVTNYRTCNFYHDKGVKGAVLSSEITASEMEEIILNTKMDIFVNIFGYQLMSFSRRKLVSNYLEYINEENNASSNYLLKAGKKFLIKENKFGTSIFTSHVLDGLSKISIFNKYNTNVILSDFNIDSDVFVKVIDIFYKGINGSDLSLLEDDLNKLIDNLSLGFLDTKTIYKVKK